MKNTLQFPALLERFFTQRLISQRQASSHTIWSAPLRLESFSHKFR